jgi:RNA polymerase sigma factor (sigma-70 family)
MFSYLTSSRSSDEEIIRNLTATGSNKQKGEDDLFGRFAYFIKVGMERYKVKEDDSFDAYSDTIISVIVSVRSSQFESRSSLKTYIFKVFHNKCVDIVRKNTTNKRSVNRTSALDTMMMQLSDTAKSAVQQIIEQSDFDEMKRKVAELGENCRALLTMFAEGYADKEIALSMEYKSAEVVKTSRLRCLERLRKMYTQTRP